MWLTALFRALSLAPYVIAGIEKIHGEASGSTKKQMAMDALSLAAGTADAVAPQVQPTVDAAAALTSNVIDGVVNVFNTTGWAAAPSAPEPTATAAVLVAAAAAPAPAAPAPTVAATAAAAPKTGD